VGDAGTEMDAPGADTRRQEMSDNPGNFVMPFGKHKGEALDDIAKTDAGLLYLDWAAGNMTNAPDVQSAVKAYLAIPLIAKDLDGLVRRKFG